MATINTKAQARAALKLAIEWVESNVTDPAQREALYQDTRDLFTRLRDAARKLKEAATAQAIASAATDEASDAVDSIGKEPEARAAQDKATR